MLSPLASSTSHNWGCLFMSVMSTDCATWWLSKPSLFLPLLASSQHPQTGCKTGSPVWGILDPPFHINHCKASLVPRFPCPCFSWGHILQIMGHPEVCAIHHSPEHCSFMKTHCILPVPIITSIWSRSIWPILFWQLARVRTALHFSFDLIHSRTNSWSRGLSSWS